MSTRAMLVAATAVAAGWNAGAAYAMAPTTTESVTADSKAIASAQSVGDAPAASERDSDLAAFAPAPELSRRGPRLQCVPFARMVSGIEIFGNANTWWQQARGRYAREREPEEGAVMVMRGYNTTTRGHVALVREKISDRVVLVDHANWLNSGEITRNVPVRDVSPRGDWSQVQVWHVPGAHWGGRTYTVQGFIVRSHDQAQAPGADVPIG